MLKVVISPAEAVLKNEIPTVDEAMLLESTKDWLTPESFMIPAP
jgi:hypothetical protein